MSNVTIVSDIITSYCQYVVLDGKEYEINVELENYTESDTDWYWDITLIDEDDKQDICINFGNIDAKSPMEVFDFVIENFEALSKDIETIEDEDYEEVEEK